MSSQSIARQPPEFIVVGRISRPHGVRGALLVEGVSDLIHSISPGGSIFIGDDNHPTIVTSLRPHRGMFLLTLDGYQNRESAEVLRSSEIKLRFDQIDLPDHEYYYWQIVGLDVQTDDGEKLGTIDRIIETGANDVYVIVNPAGEQILIPATEEVVLEVDLEAGHMIIHLLPGLR